ncbi:30S ribosomal protein S9 [Candidatus Woesebacteria bacterium]|nr:30S ribosomal protein S9 [Candidatus Woesebacteria bacterium]
MAEEVKVPKTKKVSKSTLTYYEGVGRRKSAIARVRLHLTKKGSVVIGETTHKAGAFIVNDKALEKVFISTADQMLCKKPLVVCDSIDSYVVTVKSLGGGRTGQVDAISLGLARALVQIPAADLRPKLKAEGLLTRDSRIRERRMVGTGGKSRRLKQSPKR